MDIHELRETRDKILDQMEELNEIALAEERDFSDEEQSEYDDLEKRSDSLEKRIARQEKLRERRANAEPERPERRSEPVGQPKIEARDYDGSDFKNLAEFVQAAVLNPRDQRLRSQYIDIENREDPPYGGLEMQTPASGGYLVPEQFMTTIMEFASRDVIVRPRATVIPAGSSPDAKVNIPVLEQSGTNGVYSGVTVDWIEEGGEKPETAPAFNQISLEPHEVAAHTQLTDKAIRNAPELETIVRRLLGTGLAVAEDVAFIEGDGDGKPTGFIGHSSNVTVARETAGDVTYADLVEMLSRMYFGGTPTWLVTQRMLPKLMHLEDTEGHLIWQPDARAGVPGTIFGYPVVFSNRVPAIGEPGDVSFVDLSHYLIKDGTGIAIAASEHVQFLNNRTVIKAFKLVDGRPWPESPLQDENGENVSPFVVLDTPGEGGGGDGDG